MVLDQLAPVTQTLGKLAEEGATLFDHAVGRASTAPSSWGTNPLNSSLAYFIVEGTCSLAINEDRKRRNTHFFCSPTRLLPSLLPWIRSLPLLSVTTLDGNQLPFPPPLWTLRLDTFWKIWLLSPQTALLMTSNLRIPQTALSTVVIVIVLSKTLSWILSKIKVRQPHLALKSFSGQPFSCLESPSADPNLRPSYNFPFCCTHFCLQIPFLTHHLSDPHQFLSCHPFLHTKHITI